MEAKEAVKANSMVKLTVSQGITRDELFKSLDNILKFFGCTGCGFNGHAGVIITPDLDRSRKLREELTPNFGKGVVNVEEVRQQGIY